MTLSTCLSFRKLGFVLLWCSFMTAYGQEKDLHTQSKSALKHYKQAKAYVKKFEFDKGIQRFEKALHEDPEFIEGWLAMGNAYLYLNNDGLCLVCFKKALDINPDYKKSTYAYLLMGKIYLRQGDYTTAQRYLEDYLTKKEVSPEQSQEAKALIANCNFGIEAMAHPFDYRIQILPKHANSLALQYFPALSVDEKTLYFTGRTGYDLNHDENIYYAKKLTDGNWSEPQSISNRINSQLNEGAASISADGRMLVFTSCDGRKGFGSCDIYVSNKTGDNWSIPENMGKIINSSAWDAQPSLSADGRSLYFASTRPGGVGGKDIWVAHKNREGEWQSAVNLGKPINTKEDEIAPFIHVNGETLYFSSNGRVGMGGFDIYKTEWHDSVWTVPTNLGYPLNDANDQSSLYIPSNGKSGCYTIEKKEGMHWQSKLYGFHLPDSFRVTHRSSFITGKITDTVTGLPLQANIRLFKLNDHTFFSETTSDKISGEYTLVVTENNDYAMYVEAPGHWVKDFSFSIDHLEDFDSHSLDVAIEPVKTSNAAVMYNLFFKVNDYSLEQESISALMVIYEFLKHNTSINLEIAGHTDNTGTASYNVKLSKQRARSVYDFLVSKGISASRLSYQGYGDTQPIVSNDTKEGKAKNRRIELKIKD